MRRRQANRIARLPASMDLAAGWMVRVAMASRLITTVLWRLTAAEVAERILVALRKLGDPLTVRLVAERESTEAILGREARLWATETTVEQAIQVARAAGEARILEA